MELLELDIGQFRAKGFTFRDRLDMSGHESSNVDPDINTDLMNPAGTVLRKEGNTDYRDLCNNQLSGFYHMQWEDK